MSLSHPDERRALRSAINAAMALIGLGFVGWIIWLKAEETGLLLYVAMFLLAINWTREVFHGAENTARAISFRAGKNGIEASVGDAAQEVAEAAADKADEITEGIDR